MDLIIQLSGRLGRLIEKNGLNPENIKAVKTDEKKLANPKHILNIIKSGNYDNVIFACIDTELQRFQPFMKLYIFLSGVRKGMIIDEAGNQLKYRTLPLLFRDLPLLFVELIVSIFVAGYFYLKVPILKWRLIKKK